MHGPLDDWVYLAPASNSLLQRGAPDSLLRLPPPPCTPLSFALSPPCVCLCLCPALLLEARRHLPPESRCVAPPHESRRRRESSARCRPLLPSSARSCRSEPLLRRSTDE
ncbi:hypothetical protein PR202_ga31190 [Eleusine coracana subsp. coracana]|uniref:Uncharacterized protein n=1 Tax=Eleusine coracana subsp. coracana TaxID=191504 RepID=A0AAV5DR71_ELECO|nr:hypothetical protein PR202_ga31190 [Eleusine coracana subsp. coracana]